MVKAKLPFDVTPILVSIPLPPVTVSHYRPLDPQKMVELWRPRAPGGNAYDAVALEKLFLNVKHTLTNSP